MPQPTDSSVGRNWALTQLEASEGTHGRFSGDHPHPCAGAKPASGVGPERAGASSFAPEGGSSYGLEPSLLATAAVPWVG